MAVRRLAPREVQPESFAFSPAGQAFVKAQIAKYPQGRQASAVIPLLWKAQEEAGGWLPQKAIEEVARLLDMPAIRVLEVATFYTMFNLAPVGKHFVQLCGTVPCHLVGALDLKKVCEEKIGPQGTVSSDGMFSWLEVECLGACCNAPMVQIGYDYYEDLTAENFARILDEFRAGRTPPPGPQNGRSCSEPLGGGETLTDPRLYDGSLVGAWKKRFEEAKAEAAPAAEPVAPSAPKAASEQAAKPRTTDAPEAAAARATPAASSATVAEVKAGDVAAQEEKFVADALAKLPRGASAEDKANAVGRRPAGIAAPQGGAADDLKRIRGIGKVNEGRLNALGIWHFAQIGAWSREEIRWVGTYLAFPGRIDREDWVGQAKILAAGGDTAFSKRVDKGDVPTSQG
jgi:NADH-quinone oxidoreductase subunit E